MTTLQDRIIKDFRKQFIYNGGFTKNDEAKLECELGNQAEQFLIQSIKEVEEETRKEIFEKVGEIVGNEEISFSNNEVDKIWKECVNAERFRIGHSIFLLKQSLSITNKED